MILRTIDDFMFDRIFQPIVNRFPNAGPAGVARFFVTGATLAWVAVIIHDQKYWWLILPAISLPSAYLDAGPRERLGLRNQKRIASFDFVIRMFCLWFLTFNLIDSLTPDIANLMWLAESALFMAYFYTDACDKLPPKAKTAWDRRRAWV